jgi:hypothetical protein
MKKLLLLSLLITLTMSVARAQEVPEVAPKDMVKISKNLVKFNLTSALIKNYSAQYERVLSRNISMALSFKMMPESVIPYTENIFKWVGEIDAETRNTIENLTIGNYTITPEIRFYKGKKRYGTGFYTALFYRYGHFTASNAIATFNQDDPEVDPVTMTMSGNLSSHTGGFMFGAQWALGKHMCLDWWILGPHFGVSSGNVIGLSSIPLTEEEQQSIEDEVNDIDIPMLKQTIDVSADKVTLDFSGPWAGIRAGLSFGIKF